MADENDGQTTQTETGTAQTTQTQQTGQQGATQTAQQQGTQQTQQNDKPLAAGGQAAQTDAKPAWPDDWRERMAAQVGGSDAKAVAKELKRLQRFTDPPSVYGSYRELDGRFSEGGLVKIPGKDAKPEEVAAFNKAMGVPEKPEEYLGALALPDGKVLGDADKPIAESFAKAMHPLGLTPAQMSGAVAWRFEELEREAAAQYEADQTYRAESERVLKKDWGAAFDANTRSITALFSSAPGGADAAKEDGLMARVLGGRTTDGRVIGDDPDVVRWFAALAREINPAATLVPATGGDSMKSLEAEIAAIEKEMRTDRAAYFKDQAKQDRYRELLAARDKIKGRQAA